MNTPLDKVRALNYDHHRRMTAMHMAKLEAGVAGEQSSADADSYRTLLRHVPRALDSLLELGSASGGQWPLLREWLAPDGFIDGIDLYEPLVRQAQAAGLPITLGFVEEMPYADGVYDLVCSRHVMEHLGFLKLGIAEILRVLRPGGYVAHVTPNMPIDPEPAHLNHYDATGWASVWTAAGVEVLAAEDHPFNGGEVALVGRKR